MNYLSNNYKIDLDFVVKKYEETFPIPYYCFSKDEMILYIDDYLDRTIIENDLDFLYFLKCVVKKLNGKLDNHTTVKRKGNFFPFVLKMFDDDLYVIKAVKSTEKLLYSKLVSINDMPYKKLIPEVEDTISYFTDGWRKRCIERSFNEFYSLLQLPSITAKDNKVKLGFESQINEKMFFEFQENDYQESIPQDKENCSFEIINDTIHYIYNSCRDEEKVISSVKKIKELIGNEHIKRFILDIRGNTGGNDAFILPLINCLKELNLNLFCFVDRYTFSSGIGALMDLVKLRANVIGEDVGSSINHFGSNSPVFILPNTKFKLTISTKYIDESYGDKIQQDTLVQSLPKSIKPITFVPNIVVHESINDCINKRDICLEEFLNLVK